MKQLQQVLIGMIVVTWYSGLVTATSEQKVICITQKLGPYKRLFKLVPVKDLIFEDTKEKSKIFDKQRLLRSRGKSFLKPIIYKKNIELLPMPKNFPFYGPVLNTNNTEFEEVVLPDWQSTGPLSDDSNQLSNGQYENVSEHFLAQIAALAQDSMHSNLLIPDFVSVDDFSERI